MTTTKKTSLGIHPLGKTFFKKIILLFAVFASLSISNKINAQVQNVPQYLTTRGGLDPMPHVDPDTDEKWVFFNNTDCDIEFTAWFKLYGISQALKMTFIIPAQAPGGGSSGNYVLTMKNVYSTLGLTTSTFMQYTAFQVNLGGTPTYYDLYPDAGDTFTLDPCGCIRFTPNISSHLFTFDPC